MSMLLALPMMIAASAAPAASDDFHARMLQGRLTEATSDGAAYQKKLWAQMGTPMTEALKACIKQNAPADKSPFTLVADVRVDGRPARVQVEPETPLATCTQATFATWTLPAPPSDPAPYPIEIDVSITP